MEKTRTLVYRVYGVSILSGNHITIYEDESLSAAEHFALHFDGEDREIYIKKVYRLTGSRPHYSANVKTSGREL